MESRVVTLVALSTILSTLVISCAHANGPALGLGAGVVVSGSRDHMFRPGPELNLVLQSTDSSSLGARLGVRLMTIGLPGSGHYFPAGCSRRDDDDRGLVAFGTLGLVLQHLRSSRSFLVVEFGAGGFTLEGESRPVGLLEFILGGRLRERDPRLTLEFGPTAIARDDRFALVFPFRLNYWI